MQTDGGMIVLFCADRQWNDCFILCKQMMEWLFHSVQADGGMIVHSVQTDNGMIVLFCADRQWNDCFILCRQRVE